MRSEGKGEIEEDTEVCGFRDWVDDGCSIKQDGMCGKISSGSKDSMFSLGNVIFEARHLRLSAINKVLDVDEDQPYGPKARKERQHENPSQVEGQTEFKRKGKQSLGRDLLNKRKTEVL